MQGDMPIPIHAKNTTQARLKICMPLMRMLQMPCTYTLVFLYWYFYMGISSIRICGMHIFVFGMPQMRMPEMPEMTSP